MDLLQSHIVDYTLYLLGFFSLLSWIVIIFKTGELILHRFRNNYFMNLFQNQIDKSVFNSQSYNHSQVGRLYEVGKTTLNPVDEQPALHFEQLRPWHELLERNLRQQIHKEKAELDSGLGWLATFGSVSPFVGLFGTVWGIMHALQDISQKGSASLEVVAGPIGEALIATAIGIAVAIPAVMGYNFFLRQNRAIVNKLDNFANDFLHSTIQRHLLQQLGEQHGHTNTK